MKKYPLRTAAHCPQRIPVRGHEFDRGRDHLAQQCRRTRIDPEPAEQSRVPEHRKVALVGKQRVCSGMRHQRDVPCQVSLTNVCMRGILEREIGQPVVDSVDSTVGILKPVRTKRQILGSADHAVHAMVPKRVRVQHKLGVKELRSRSAVHDGQARRRAPGLLPSILHPGRDGRITRLGRVGPGGPCWRRARPHGIEQQGIEEQTAWIGVDLDQPRAIDRQVKVQTQDAPRRTRIMGCNVRGPLQDPLAISRVSCDVEDRRRDSSHGLQRGPINEQGIG